MNMEIDDYEIKERAYVLEVMNEIRSRLWNGHDVQLGPPSELEKRIQEEALAVFLSINLEDDRNEPFIRKCEEIGDYLEETGLFDHLEYEEEEDQLEQLLSHEYGFWRNVRKFCKKHKKVLMVVGGAAAVIGATVLTGGAAAIIGGGGGSTFIAGLNVTPDSKKEDNPKPTTGSSTQATYEYQAAKQAHQQANLVAAAPKPLPPPVSQPVLVITKNNSPLPTFQESFDQAYQNHLQVNAYHPVTDIGLSYAPSTEKFVIGETNALTQQLIGPDFWDAVPPQALQAGFVPPEVPHHPLNFAFGLAIGLPQGAYDSGAGILSFGFQLVSHPINTVSQVVESIEYLASLARSGEWAELGDVLKPEVVELVQKWDNLSSYEQGVASGHLIGKYGVDLLALAGTVKLTATAIKAVKTATKPLELTKVPAVAGGITLAEEVGVGLLERPLMGNRHILEKPAIQGVDRFASNPVLKESYELHQRAKELLKPYTKEFMSEAKVRKIIHEAGFPTYPRPKGIPENFRVRITDKGAGIEYVHPEHTHTTIRIMPGKPHSSFPYQQKPYVIQTKDGVAFDKFGKPTSRAAPEAHIPIEEFILRIEL